MIIDNPNVLTLARSLEQIPDILQVRFHKAIRPRLLHAAGDNSIVFTLVLNSVTVLGQIQLLRFVAPAIVINDLEHHESVVNNVTQLVNEYLKTGIPPTKLMEARPLDPIENIITTASIIESYIPEPVSPAISEDTPTP